MTVEQYAPQGQSQIQQWHDTSDDNATLARVEGWARAAVQVRSMAEQLCSTSFVPAQFRGKADEATAAMLAGIELGFSPMGALRAFDVIQGVAAPKAITHRAVVQSQGHSIWVEESTDVQCTVRGHRKDSEQIVESVWTIERASKLGLTGKDQWKKQPKAMLVARATSECARFIASDALLGMPYSVEEIRDDTGLTEPHPDAKRALPSPRQAQRGGTSVSAADLTGDAPVDAPAVESTDVQMIDRAQGKRIGDLFKAAGVDDKGARARIVDSLTDRPVKSAAELTHDEAAALVSELEEMGPDDIAALADIPAQTVDADGESLWPEVKGPGGDQ